MVSSILGGARGRVAVCLSILGRCCHGPAIALPSTTHSFVPRFSSSASAASVVKGRDGAAAVAEVLPIEFSKTKDNREADEHSDVFDEIFEVGESNSPSQGHGKVTLSALIAQNSKAFVPHQREKGKRSVVIDSSQHRIKGKETFKDEKHEEADINSRSSYWSDISTEDDTDVEEEMEINAAERQRMQRTSHIPDSRDRHSKCYGSRKDAPERDFDGRSNANGKLRQIQNGHNQSRRKETSDVKQREELGSGCERGFQRFRAKDSRHQY